MGRGSQKSPVKMYQELEPKGSKWHIHGYVAMAGNVIMLMCYCTITGGLLQYFVDTAADRFAGLDVLLIRPNMYPLPVQIGCELKDLQKAVGGDVQAVYPYEDPVALVMDEEAKLTGKDLNRALRDEDGGMYDIVAGDFLVVGLGEEDFCSLTPEQMKKYEEHFHQPEMFVRMGRSIMALPLPDDKVKKADAPEKAAPTPHKSSPDRDSL